MNLFAGSSVKMKMQLPKIDDIQHPQRIKRTNRLFSGHGISNIYRYYNYYKIQPKIHFQGKLLGCFRCRSFTFAFRIENWSDKSTVLCGFLARVSSNALSSIFTRFICRRINQFNFGPIDFLLEKQFFNKMVDVFFCLAFHFFTNAIQMRFCWNCRNFFEIFFG